jgi:hypothetical protein
MELEDETPVVEARDFEPMLTSMMTSSGFEPMMTSMQTMTPNRSSDDDSSDTGSAENSENDSTDSQPSNEKGFYNVLTINDSIRILDYQH